MPSVASSSFSPVSKSARTVPGRPLRLSTRTSRPALRRRYATRCPSSPVPPVTSISDAFTSKPPLDLAIHSEVSGSLDRLHITHHTLPERFSRRESNLSLGKTCDNAETEPVYSFDVSLFRFQSQWSSPRGRYAPLQPEAQS